MPIIKFQANWKNHFPWVQEGRSKMTAHCIWCNSSFSYDGMGRAALTSHAKGKKHQAMASNRAQSIPINKLLQTHPDTSQNSSLVGLETQPSTSSQIQTNVSTCSNQKTINMSLDKYKIRDSVTEAEIMWCIHTVINHYSLRNAESSVMLFSKMFKECSIANEMKLHKDKIAYSIVFGIAPYFKDILRSSLDQSSNFVIGFDETFNKVAQRTQMDLSVRFWDIETDSVKSRYLGSVFLNQCKATDLLEAFKSGIEGLSHEKILQISMDGPNVNWAFLRILKQELCANLRPDAPQLLELGSCGLHVLHGAFKAGMLKTDWNIIKFLRALYNLFKMVPSRRGHYTAVTQSSLFPLQFCNIRCVESAKVARRAIEMFPHLEKYINTVTDNKQEPTCNSYKIVKSAMGDKLLLAKVTFFQSLAEEFEPFLKEFQSDAPMVPFLHQALTKLLRNIMSRFVKKEEMAKRTFYKVNVFEKDDGIFKSLIAVKEIEIGYATKSALRKCSGLSDKDYLGLRKDIRTCYQHVVLKIQEKSPLKYPLTKALSFLNPNLVLEDEHNVFKEMEAALDIMIQANVITACDAERADREFREVVTRPQFKLKAEHFKRNEDRVDRFWITELTNAVNLRVVLKKCLILSHGNATIERGFSVNKDILSENMREESLIAQRIIYDSITDCGGMQQWTEAPMPKKMLHSMRNAYSRCKEAEEHRKRTMTEKDQRAAEKRKATFHLKELEERKKRAIQKLKEELNNIDEEIEKIKS